MAREEKAKRLEEEKELEKKRAIEENQKRREADDKKKVERNEKLKLAWEYKFNLLMDDNLQAADNFEEQMKTGFQLFKFMGDFRTKSIDSCKSIIDQLHLPVDERTHGARELTLGDG